MVLQLGWEGEVWTMASGINVSVLFSPVSTGEEGVGPLRDGRGSFGDTLETPMWGRVFQG